MGTPGFDILNARLEYDERIKALFRSVLNKLPALIVFDDFEQNLKRRGNEFKLKAEIVAKIEGGDFHTFLRQAALYRQPVPVAAFAKIGDAAMLEQGVRLTLIEKELILGHETRYWVMSVIRDSQSAKVPDQNKIALYRIAYDWYDKSIHATESPDYSELEEAGQRLPQRYPEPFPEPAVDRHLGAVHPIAAPPIAGEPGD